jgi:twitching motility protein PilT
MSFNITFETLLQEVLDRSSSDLHISLGAPAMLRVDGTLQPTQQAPEHILTADESKALCFRHCTPEMIKELEAKRELDFSFDFEGRSRFRANVFFQMGAITGAFRPIPSIIPTMEDLNLPDALKGLTNLPRGLILVTGPTGSGKSTTMASMLGHINQTRGEHIITVEDPIEFVHKSKKSLIAQREIGKDTKSFVNALKYALRQDPDILLIGEMRDMETIGAAITIAETGHLVFGTLHTNTAIQTINRIIDVFPAHQQSQIRTQLSFILMAVVSQQLVPKIGGGRCLAQEIMIPNHAIRNLIREDKVHQLYTSMQIGQQQSGMCTFNQNLAQSVKKGIITKEDALEHGTDMDELKKMLGMKA